MRWPLVSTVLLLVAVSILSVPVESRATQCFYGDFDTDDDPWTIRTSCADALCDLDFIVEAGEISPAGENFTIIVTEGCCDYLYEGDYGTLVEMNMNSAYIDSWSVSYTTCTCCSSWYIDGHFRSDAVFDPGQRYVIGSGTAQPLCNDTHWDCIPSHTFHAEFWVEHMGYCDGNSIAMELQCPTSDAPDAVMAAARLGMPSPNPVTDALRFTVNLPEAGPARVRVYDASGAIVATLVDEEFAAGTHPQAWRPVDARGSRLASGIYFLRLDASGVRASRPFVVAR